MYQGGFAPLLLVGETTSKHQIRGNRQQRYTLCMAFETTSFRMHNVHGLSCQRNLVHIQSYFKHLWKTRNVNVICNTIHLM